MDFMKRYENWLENLKNNKNDLQVLEEMKSNQETLKDAFYKEIQFGTAGLRGIVGLGTNRMNYYTIGRATQGIADYIIEKGGQDKGVAIAYDCRHFAQEFANYTAGILAGNGIKAYVYPSLRSTPQLSYTISKLKTISGINLTASHNPKEYSGYKVYWEDAAQVMEDVANSMMEKIKVVDMFNDVKVMDFEEGKAKGLINIIGEDIDRAYLDLVKSLTINEDIDKDIQVVYTPLNGAGNIPMKTIFAERGFKNLHIVPEQAEPDPDFTTVGYPNPEDTKAFAYAEKLGKEVGAEILLATDPDADRIAMEVLDENGEYISFNGNQVGVILINYILEAMKEKGTLPKNGAMVKSIVTGDMGTAICEAYGVKMFETLTGFKNICGKIPVLHENNLEYLFGYEESVGYAPSEEVRDKDGISTAMLLCESAAYYKKQGKTMLQVLNELFDKYGNYQEVQVSLVLEGAEGAERISRMMKEYRKDYIKTFDNMNVMEVIDYINGYKDIGASDVLKFILSDGSWFALRPSGTEPKIKFYIYSKGETKEVAMTKINIIKESLLKRLDEIK